MMIKRRIAPYRACDTKPIYRSRLTFLHQRDRIIVPGSSFSILLMLNSPCLAMSNPLLLLLPKNLLPNMDLAVRLSI